MEGDLDGVFASKKQPWRHLAHRRLKMAANGNGQKARFVHISHALSWIGGNGIRPRRNRGQFWGVRRGCLVYDLWGGLCPFSLVLFYYRFSLGVLHAWDAEEGNGGGTIRSIMDGTRHRRKLDSCRYLSLVDRRGKGSANASFLSSRPSCITWSLTGIPWVFSRKRDLLGPWRNLDRRNGIGSSRGYPFRRATSTHKIPCYY